MENTGERVAMIRNALEKRNVKFLEASEGLLNELSEKYGIVFPNVLRDFYLGGIPVGSRYPEWCSGTEHAEKEIRRMLHFPTKSIVAAVENDDFWTMEWGEKPDSMAEAVSSAKEWLKNANEKNPLIPLVGHCYLVCNGTKEAGPVISVFGDDVVIMGENLLDFFEKRCGAKENTPVSEECVEACGAWKVLVG